MIQAIRVWLELTAWAGVSQIAGGLALPLGVVALDLVGHPVVPATAKATRHVEATTTSSVDDPALRRCRADHPSRTTPLKYLNPRLRTVGLG